MRGRKEGMGEGSKKKIGIKKTNKDQKKQIGIKKTNLKTKGGEGRKEGKKERSNLLLKNERKASFS